MFTGIVEELGTVVAATANADGSRLVIAADIVMSDIELGASIAVNGCCLTVVDIGEGQWSADAVPETLARTSLGDAVVGSVVNLERPMAADGRFGGHIVQGHVDSTATVATIEELSDGSHRIGFVLPADQRRYVVEKGSVTVDGVSLTVASLTPDGFEIAVIPHTWEVTRFQEYAIGTTVNIEVDLVAKYIERLLTGAAPTGPAPSQGQHQQSQGESHD